MAKKKNSKSKGLVNADGERWYNSIDPGIDTTWGSAIYNGPGILFRLATGVERDTFAPEHEENLWRAYTMGGTDGLPKSKIRFDGEDLGDADVVGLPKEQAFIVQAVADTLYADQMRKKVRGYTDPNLWKQESMRRKAMDYQELSRNIINNPGEWVLVGESSSPVRKTSGSEDRQFNYSGLGGLKSFYMRWNPDDSTLDVKDEYDFKDEGVEGNIPRRDRRLFIRDKIKFNPKKGSRFYRNPEMIEELGYKSRFGNGGLIDFEPEDGISLYYIPAMDDGGSISKWTKKDEKDFQEWYASVSNRLGLNPDPDDSEQYYDYRSFWKENPKDAQKMLNAEEGSHFTDKYKLPGHPTFSNESIYSTDETPGGSWEEHDGRFYYVPSDYTKLYIDRTMNYLSGQNEGIHFGDEYIMVPKMPDGGTVGSPYIAERDNVRIAPPAYVFSTDEIGNEIPYTIGLPQVIVTAPLTQEARRRAEARRGRNYVYQGQRAVVEPIVDAVSAVGGFLPVVGEGMDAIDLWNAMRSGDYDAAGLSALGFLPGLGTFRDVERLHDLTQRYRRESLRLADSPYTSMQRPSTLTESEREGIGRSNRSSEGSIKNQSEFDTDYNALKAFSDKYGYKIKNKGEIKSSSELDDEYRRIISQHNTFVRGVRADNRQDAESFLSTPTLFTGAGRYAAPYDRDVLYTSNSYDTALGYASGLGYDPEKGNGWVGVVRRAGLNFQPGKSRSEWLKNADFGYNIYDDEIRINYLGNGFDAGKRIIDSGYANYGIDLDEGFIKDIKSGLDDYDSPHGSYSRYVSERLSSQGIDIKNKELTNSDIKQLSGTHVNGVMSEDEYQNYVKKIYDYRNEFQDRFGGDSPRMRKRYDPFRIIFTGELPVGIISELEPYDYYVIGTIRNPAPIMEKEDFYKMYDNLRKEIPIIGKTGYDESSDIYIGNKINFNRSMPYQHYIFTGERPVDLIGVQQVFGVDPQKYTRLHKGQVGDDLSRKGFGSGGLVCENSFSRALREARGRGDARFLWNGRTFDTEEKCHGGALFEETGDIWTTGLDVVRTLGDGGLVERQDHVYERLTEDYNMPPLQAVAIIANLTAESGLDPLAEGDSGQSVGIQQWKGERRKKLEAAARKNGDFLPSLDDQIDFLMSEYTGGGFQFRDQGRNLYADGKVDNSIFDYYQYSKGEFDNADNLWDATIAWNQGVGRPNKKFAANEKRFKIAQEVADRHGVKYNETSRYDVMGPLSVPPESIYKEKDEANAVQVQGNGSDIEEREKEFMSHVEELLSLSERKSGNVNIYINDSADVSKSLEADDLETRRRIAESEQREKERRLIEAVLPGIQLNIRTI